MTGKWEDYLQFMNAQLTELLTNYGPVGGIWFDGWWDKKEAPWQLEEQYALIHRLQPGCLIGNNHHQAVKEGEDFQMFGHRFGRQLPIRTGSDIQQKIGIISSRFHQKMNDRPYRLIMTVMDIVSPRIVHRCGFCRVREVEVQTG